MLLGSALVFLFEYQIRKVMTSDLTRSCMWEGKFFSPETFITRPNWLLLHKTIFNMKIYYTMNE